MKYYPVYFIEENQDDIKSLKKQNSWEKIK